MRPRHLRLVTRLAALLLLAVAAGVAVKRALPTYLREPIESQLESAGFSAATFRIESVGISHIRLSSLELAPDLRIGELELKFGRWGVVGGRIEAMVLRDARCVFGLDGSTLEASSLARLLQTNHELTRESASPESIHLEGAQVILEREGEDILIGVEGRLLPKDGLAELRVESALGLHRVSVDLHREASHGSLVHIGLRGITERSDGDLTARFSSDSPSPVQWKVSARFPATWLPTSASARLTGPIEFRSTGTLRPLGTRNYALERVISRITFPHFQALRAELALDHVRALLMADGALEWGDMGPALKLDINPTSRLEIDRAVIDEWQAEGLVATPDLHLTFTTESFRAWPRRPISVFAGALLVGRGRGVLRIDDPFITLSVTPHEPLVEITHHEGQLHFVLDGEAPKLNGALRGRRVRARGGLSASFGSSSGEQLDGSFRLFARHIIEPQSRVALDDARMNLVIRTNEEDNVLSTGQLGARVLSFDGHPLGRVHGKVRIAKERITLTGIAPRLRARADMGLEHGDGYAHIEVPWTVLREHDGLHDVLAETTGLEITGNATGRLRVNLRRPNASRAELELRDATVVHTAQKHRATGVHAVVRLTHLDPLVSEAPVAVSFREVRLDDTITLGQGTARLRFERTGHLGIESAVASLGGGRVRVAPLRFAPDDPELALRLSFEGVDVDRFVRAISDGRASGTGELDGQIAMRVAFGRAPKLVLGEGRFAARGQGRIRIPGEMGPPRRPIALEQLGNSDWVQDRVLHALRDFEYSRLVLDVVGEDDSKRVVARLAGRGARTPQELDLTLNVRGIQPVVDELLNLWRDTNSRTR